MKKLEKFKSEEVNSEMVKGGINIDYSVTTFTTETAGNLYDDKRVDDVCVSWLNGPEGQG